MNELVGVFVGLSVGFGITLMILCLGAFLLVKGRSRS